MQSKKNSINSQSATTLKKPGSSIHFQGQIQNKKNVNIDKSQKRNIDSQECTNRNNKKIMNYFTNDNNDSNKKLKTFCSQKVSPHHQQTNQQDNYSLFVQGKLTKKQEKSLVKNIKEDKQHKAKKQKQEKSGISKMKKKQNKVKQCSQKCKTKPKNKQNNSNSNSNTCSVFKTFIQNDSTLQTTHRNAFTKTHKNSKSQFFSGNQSPSKTKHKMVIDLRIKQKSGYQSTHRSTNRLNSKIRGRNGEKTPKLQDLPSTRQYCIIKGKFVPLQSSTDRKYVDQMLEETATTSPDPTYKKFINKIKYQSQQNHQNQHQNQHISYNYNNISTNTDTNNTNNNNNKNKNISTHSQIGIQTIKTQLAHYQVLVKAAQQDIGIQYSDRSAQNSNRKFLQDKIKLQSILSDNNNNKILEVESQQQKSQRTTLLQTMMKLQSLQLDENGAIQNLNIEQKRHFRQICEILLTKMKSPRIQNPPNMPRSSQQILQIQKIKTLTKSPTSIQISPQIVVLQQIAKNEQLQQLLMLRQSKQTNQFNIILKSPQHIDTSLISILSTFSDIFCFVQMGYQQNLLQNMNAFYGLSYGDKYKFISNYYNQIRRSNKMRSNLLKLQNTSIAEMIKIETLKKQLVIKPIPDSVFLRFMKQMSQDHQQQQQQQQLQQQLKQNNSSQKCKIYSPQQIQKLQQLKIQTQSYLWIHNKCIFDCINQLIVPYKPFYPTKGDPFIWSINPLKCLTFYSIDSQSLQTVIEQIQQKITAIVRNLCGIHVEGSKYNSGNYMEKQQNKDWNKDIVFLYRREKLNKTIVQQSKNQDGDDNYLLKEIQETCVLYQISMFIQEQLFKEFYNEFRQLNQK